MERRWTIFANFDDEHGKSSLVRGPTVARDDPVEVVDAVSFDRLKEENAELRRIIAAYDSPGALGEVFAVVAGMIEQRDDRIEELESSALAGGDE